MRPALAEEVYARHTVAATRAAGKFTAKVLTSKRISGHTQVTDFFPEVRKFYFLLMYPFNPFVTEL